MESYGEYQTTLFKALTEIDKNWKSYDGLIIAGTHNPKDYDILKLLRKIQDAREKERPALLICFGFQLGAIEYARNVLGIKRATSEEWSEKGPFVVKKRKDLKVGLHGGESFWNNYEVVIDWEPTETQFATQSHPEYQSSIDRPHPLLIKFLNYCKKYETR